MGKAFVALVVYSAGYHLLQVPEWLRKVVSMIIHFD